MDLFRRDGIDVNGMPSVIPGGPDLMSKGRPICLKSFKKRLRNICLFVSDDCFYSVKNWFEAPIPQRFRCSRVSEFQLSNQSVSDFENDAFSRCAYHYSCSFETS